jgi:protein-disulfide isomerase
MLEDASTAEARSPRYQSRSELQATLKRRRGVSRGYNARRKAKRQQARAAAEPPQRQSSKDSRRPVILLPILAIAGILVATAIVGFGAGGSPSQKQIDQEVTALLAGIPQQGTTLGSQDAPVTLQMFADLECPTVKRFVESYLPSIISDWVRTGTVKLQYRSLKTDTVDEGIFFSQEEAARAAGRQNRLWNFALTFVRQQGQRFTEYANDAFLVHVASQVPELSMGRWNRDRRDISLFKPIALNIHSAHARGLRYTPSFVMAGNADRKSLQEEIKASLEKDIQALEAEASGEVPSFKVS